MLARQLGLDDLAAHRGGGLLAATVIGAFRPVDVVVAGDAGRHAVILAVVAGHAFAEQLLPAVAVFRQGRIGVGFLQRRDVGLGLLVAVVDAGRRRIEEARHARLLGGDQHVGADQHRQHALRLVGLDEPHAAHVGGQVVDHLGVLGRLAAGLEQGQVAHLVLDARRLLVPLLERLHVHGADLAVTALLKHAHQMATDEATGTGDDHEIILRHKPLHKGSVARRTLPSRRSALLATWSAEAHSA